MGIRVVGVRAEGEEMAAEPVPVRRPGVRVIGDDAPLVGEGTSRVSHTGSTKIGFNLRGDVNLMVRGDRSICNAPERKPENFHP